MAADEKVVLHEEEIGRALTRIAHEILERNADGPAPALVGIHRRGAFLAQQAAPAAGGAARCGGAARRPRHRLLPRRRRHAPRRAGAARLAHRLRRHRADGRDRRRRAVHRTHRARRDRGAVCTTGARSACSWRCSPTADTASCRSAPTTSARTSRRRSSEHVYVRLRELDGVDEVSIAEPRAVEAAA